jgi:hypothetical protein
MFQTSNIQTLEGWKLEHKRWSLAPVWQSFGAFSSSSLPSVETEFAPSLQRNLPSCSVFLSAQLALDTATSHTIIVTLTKETFPFVRGGSNPSTGRRRQLGSECQHLQDSNRAPVRFDLGSGMDWSLDSIPGGRGGGQLVVLFVGARCQKQSSQLIPHQYVLSVQMMLMILFQIYSFQKRTQYYS